MKNTEQNVYFSWKSPVGMDKCPLWHHSAVQANRISTQEVASATSIYQGEFLDIVGKKSTSKSLAEIIWPESNIHICMQAIDYN